MDRQRTERRDHLRGKDRRSAEDIGQGKPRPDEIITDEPAGIQASHAGRPTNDPEPELRDDSGVGITNTPTRDHRGTPRSRYAGHGRDTEGAFGTEEPGAEQP
jgi:hypothetical protein